MHQFANKNSIKPFYIFNLFFKFSTVYFLKVFLSILFMIALCCISIAQSRFEYNTQNPDEENILQQYFKLDSIQAPDDTTFNDNEIEAKVEYNAIDSMRFNLKTKSVFLYNKAFINYKDIKLEAADIKILFNNNLLFANGVLDSSNNLVGNPIFTEDAQEYKSKFMKYNYKTKKAFIKEVFTEDGEGFLHGKTIKKLEDESINVNEGSFTTCSNEEHPHFEFRYNKSKVIPGKKIITGPAFLVIEDVPTPLFIPFGLFPNKKGQRSGLIIPTYGESANRGFYLENGGYYWAINDYIDLKLTGDVYTYGSWAVKLLSNYVKKYKYRGSLNLTYATNKDKDAISPRKDFAIRWQHAQDAKARPNSRFTSNVNVVSSKYNIYNPTSSQDYLSNTFQSGVSYQTKIAGKHSLTINGNHSQNTQTKIVNITLPEISLSANRFYPFRKKEKSGNLKWYDNISVNYTLNAKNTASVPDSLLFGPGFEKMLRNGVRQNIPISLPIKLLKYFNLTTSVNVLDRIYFSRLKKTMIPALDENNQPIPSIVVDTISGFFNIFEYSFSSSLSTKIYGILQFKKGPIRAIRHVFTPTISFSFTPDFSTAKWGYYDYVYTDIAKTQKEKYSKFENYIYGSPSNRERNIINLSFSNNIEMKVPSKKDTITGLKKIVLIEDLRITTTYDFTKDSLNWSPILISGRTTLFKKLRISYSSRWNPYAVDRDGNVINQFEWDFRKNLLRRESTQWNFSIDYQLSSNSKSKNKSIINKPIINDENINPSDQTLNQEYLDILENPDEFVDWNIPWSLNLSYSFNRNVNIRYFRSLDGKFYDSIPKTISKTQTLGIRGDVNITKNTKISFTTGYDFINKDISYTSLNFHRDLHCWEMRFNWIPLGPRKSWNFTLAIKSTLLQDLKLEKRKDFRDR